MLLLFLTLLCTSALAFDVKFNWKEVDFIFPESSKKEDYISDGSFVPINNLMLDVDAWNGDSLGQKVFVTFPKFKSGVPVSLATVTDQVRNGTTLLQPYPDWSWHEGDCSGILSVFRIKVDQCGRLWVLDSGKTLFMGNEPTCPPQVLIFDLNTDKLIRRHRFPSGVVDKHSLLITITVDTRTPDCSDSMAYIADVKSFKLVVYDFKSDSSWAIANKYFYPYPLHGSFHINGVDFELMDGIFGLALGPLQSDGDRILYFHSLASVHESWVSTSVIRNRTLFSKSPGASPGSFHVFNETRESQSAAQDMAPSGVLFYGLVQENAVGCWNSRLPFESQNMDIVSKDDETLQFQSGLKVVGNEVWVLSCRFPNFRTGKISLNEVNYHINVGNVDDLVKDTRCEPQGHPQSSC